GENRLRAGHVLPGQPGHPRQAGRGPEARARRPVGPLRRGGAGGAGAPGAGAGRGPLSARPLPGAGQRGAPRRGRRRPPGGRGGGAFGGDHPPPEQSIPEEYRGRLGSITTTNTVPQLRKFLESGGTILAVGSSTVLGNQLGLPLANHLTGKDEEGKERPLT